MFRCLTCLIVHPIENADNTGRFSLYCLIKATDEEKILREDINIVSGQ